MEKLQKYTEKQYDNVNKMYICRITILYNQENVRYK
jgi:hypothetical protein